MTKIVVDTASLIKKQINVSIAIIGWFFFIFGFVSWINVSLIPYFKIGFELTNFQSYLVTFAFYISYLIFSVSFFYLLYVRISITYLFTNYEEN